MLPVEQGSDSFCVTIVHHMRLREVNSRRRLGSLVVRPPDPQSPTPKLVSRKRRFELLFSFFSFLLEADDFFSFHLNIKTVVRHE